MPRKKDGDKTPGSGVARTEAVPRVCQVTDDELDLVTTDRLAKAIGRRSSVYAVAMVPAYGRTTDTTEVFYGSKSCVPVVDVFALSRRLLKYVRALVKQRMDVDKLEAELGD